MGFMKPEMALLDRETAHEAAMQSDPYAKPEDFPKMAWYGRLSASGYLDATDWQGPYESKYQALQAVMELHDCDENGDTPDDME